MLRMVIDGNSVVNRAYYGVKPLLTHDGRFTHAVYGFLNILLKLMDDEKPDAVCVSFDLRAPTFRHLEYDGYKAKRKPMPEELAQQLEPLKKILAAMNIPVFQVEGYEADDIIGTIARLGSGRGDRTLIVTGDRDSLQLIDGSTQVRLVTTKNGQPHYHLYDEESFREEYGFAPPVLVDLKALMGDSSDNIPGVPGVGEKTAKELLLRFGTLDGVYENLGEIKDSVRKKLESGRESALLSHRLATINREVPIEFQDCRRCEPDRPALHALLLDLELMKLIERLGLSGMQALGETGELEAEREGRIVEAGEIPALLAELEKAEYVALQMRDDLSVAALAWDGKLVFVLGDRLGAAWEGFLRGLFPGNIRKVANDVKSLIRRLMDAGLPSDGFVFDTALAAYLADPSAGDYTVPRLSARWLNAEIEPEKDFQAPEAFAPLLDTTAALKAMGRHCCAVESLYTTLAPRLESLGMTELYYEIELPLCEVLAAIEYKGFLLNRDKLSEFAQMLTERVDESEKKIYSLAGGEFNINSTKQLGGILFERLGLPPVKKTKTGYSTNAEVLEKLRGEHEIVAEILEYRMLTKLKSTYADGLIKLIAPDGRIHTNLQNMATATGRLSSTEPNLQNIPVRQDLGSSIRRMFEAPEGCVLVDADYSQIELRVLAHIADDEAMRGVFAAGGDFHAATAAQIFGVDPAEVTPQMRRSAKAVNFGIVYGISDFSLAQDTGVTRKEAKAYIESYLARFSGVRRYMTDVVEEARKSGYVETIMHRRRWLPELKASNFNVRSGAERMALNTPVQGSAADIIKLAMLRVHRRLAAEGLEARLVLQVHDELIVECPESERDAAARILTEEMENAAVLTVPLVAEAKSGRTWGDAK